VYNFTNAIFTMSGGEISNNTAGYGGGIYNSGKCSITGGSIISNTANSSGAVGTYGSGGGIYATNFTNLTVMPSEGNEIVFSGNTAPALRTNDVTASADADKNKTPDLTDYANIGDVVLDVFVLNALVGPFKNAPAFNNYDINYPGDVYVVSVSSDPNGGGNVTVSDTTGGNEYVIKNGIAFVPSTAKSLTFSAVPGEGYDFVQFVFNGTQTTGDVQYVVPVSGGMSAVAEFKIIEYTMTVSADDGAVISPSGDGTVPYGGDITFTFSAKEGFQITAVYVDGDEISNEELTSGQFTFADVRGDHTISVVSEVVIVEEDKGNDSGSSHKEDNGYVNYPGPGWNNDKDTNGGEGTVSDGNGVGDSDVASGPGVSTGSGWSVLGMICAVLAVFTGMIAIAAGKGSNAKGTGSILRVLALIIGIVSAIMFYFTADAGMQPVASTGWTPLLFILLLVALILTMVSFRFDKTEVGRKD